MTRDALIHLVDDDDCLRSALARLLTAAGYAVREYGSAGDFLLDAQPDAPGCLILDLRMPGPSGLDLQDALQRRGIGLPVIFLTGRGSLSEGIRAMKAGAVDFLTKPVARADLLDAIQRALEGDAARRAALTASADLAAKLARLTPRERAVFDGIVDGKLNKQIAFELGVSERTVKAQRAQVMAKLDVGNAAELGRFSALLNGRR